MSTMIISCSTCALRGRRKDEIEETFQYAAGAGFDHWALAGPFSCEPGLIQWLDVAKLKARAQAAGFIGCTEIWTPPISNKFPDWAEVGAEHVKLCADVAVQLNCPVLVQTGGSPRSNVGLKNTIHGLKKLMNLVANLPVKVALEPHVNSQILLPADYEQIFREIPTKQIGITVDVGHFHSAGVNWKQVIHAWPDRIYNVHVKDHIGPQSVAIGRGEIDLVGLVRELRAIGYRGALAVEMEVADPNNLHQYLPEAHRHLTNLLRLG